jgi:uncharacterized protein YegP (UPF0339 family)
MRKVSGLTQQEFAAHRGVSVQALKQLEQGRGNPTVETLNKLAAVFGLEVGLKPKRRPTMRRTAPPAFVLRRSGAQYMFTLQASNGQVLLTSERYKTKAAAVAGMESVRRNSVAEGRFVRRRATNGSAYFVLQTGNGEVIGTSETFASDADLDKAMEAVRNGAPDAELRELSEKPSFSGSDALP